MIACDVLAPGGAALRDNPDEPLETPSCISIHSLTDWVATHQAFPLSMKSISQEPGSLCIDWRHSVCRSLCSVGGLLYVIACDGLAPGGAALRESPDHPLETPSRITIHSITDWVATHQAFPLSMKGISQEPGSLC